MGAGLLAMTAVVLGVPVTLWWWKRDRDVGNRGLVSTMLGIRHGEQVARLWAGSYHLDRGLGDKVDELLGAGARGVAILVALTSEGRLRIGDAERHADARVFDKGQVAITTIAGEPERRKLGRDGAASVRIGLLTPTDGSEPFRIQIAKTALDELVRWAA